MVEFLAKEKTVNGLNAFGVWEKKAGGWPDLCERVAPWAAKMKAVIDNDILIDHLQEKLKGLN